MKQEKNDQQSKGSEALQKINNPTGQPSSPEELDQRIKAEPDTERLRSYTEMLERFPAKAVEKAVRGMLPKNSLARDQLSKLKVYAGPEHPHQAQGPQPFEITQVAQ
jgi:large subunit ribosomal protein L13